MTWHRATPPVLPEYWRAAPVAAAAEPGRGPAGGDVQHKLLVPHRSRQEMMQPARPAVADRLRDGPAVLVLEFHQQAARHLGAGLPGFPAGKAPGHFREQVRQQRRADIVIGYRGSSGCRLIVVFHKPIMSGSRPRPRPDI
jgi:hypothetical protein